jgi:beta-lactamase superfamily II metal-dependent hydrolase
MKVEVIAEANPEITENPVNNQSAVFRITENGFTFLVLGDLGVEAGEKLMKSGEILRADGVQMAHHGQQGVTEEFYQRIQPKYCFWPTPEWLWKNNVPNWNFKTPETASWMKKLNTVNILNFEYTVMFDTETKEVVKF